MPLLVNPAVWMLAQHLLGPAGSSLPEGQQQCLTSGCAVKSCRLPLHLSRAAVSVQSHVCCRQY